MPVIVKLPIYGIFLTAIEMPFGISPVLEVDDTKISGSLNILRYLGERFGKFANM